MSDCIWTASDATSPHPHRAVRRDLRDGNLLTTLLRPAAFCNPSQLSWPHLGIVGWSLLVWLFGPLPFIKTYICLHLKSSMNIGCSTLSTFLPLHWAWASLYLKDFVSPARSSVSSSQNTLLCCKASPFNHCTWVQVLYPPPQQESNCSLPEHQQFGICLNRILRRERFSQDKQHFEVSPTDAKWAPETWILSPEPSSHHKGEAQDTIHLSTGKVLPAEDTSWNEKLLQQNCTIIRKVHFIKALHNMSFAGLITATFMWD